MATPFEQFIQDELPKRPSLETNTTVGYDSDPNLPGAPDTLKNAPKGTYYLQSSGTLWFKATAGVATWTQNAGSAEGGIDVTEENFTLTLSLTGTDPTSPRRIRTQAEADAWGAFKTIKAALAALPDLIGHRIDLQFPAGVWNVGTEEFRDYSRFRCYTDQEHSIPIIGICLTGDNSWEQIAGTTLMAVQSYSGNIIVLQADPGLVEDAFMAYYLVVTSGTGAGQFKPIRHHSGTSIQIAGAYSPALNSTSVVQISKRATTLNWLTTAGYIEICGGNNYWTNPELNFMHINVESTAPTSYTTLTQQNAPIYFGEGCRTKNIRISCQESRIWMDDCIFDHSTRIATGNNTHIILIQGGTIRNRYSSSRVQFFCGNPSYPLTSAIYLYAIGDSKEACGYLYAGLVFQGFYDSYFRFLGNCQILMGSTTGFLYASDQDAEAAIRLDLGARCTIYYPMTGIIASSFKGSVTDVRVDSSDVIWEDIDADPQKVVTGVYGSAFTNIEDIFVL